MRHWLSISGDIANPYRQASSFLARHKSCMFSLHPTLSAILDALWRDLKAQSALCECCTIQWSQPVNVFFSRTSQGDISKDSNSITFLTISVVRSFSTGRNDLVEKWHRLRQWGLTWPGYCSLTWRTTEPLRNLVGHQSQMYVSVLTTENGLIFRKKFFLKSFEKFFLFSAGQILERYWMFFSLVLVLLFRFHRRLQWQSVLALISLVLESLVMEPLVLEFLVLVLWLRRFRRRRH